MSYERQDRGDAAAYATYFAGMDASMQQKIALTTAYFPTRGRIADMGCGSGRGTYDLACLYQGLALIGIDINPVMVEYARTQYHRPNLSYMVGDIAEPIVPSNTLDGVLNSSVLHHVTSFNGYDLGRALAALDRQATMLRDGGVLIVRDFVIPDGPDEVLLDLPYDDGSAEGEPPELSSAALFERFGRDFRSSVNPGSQVAYQRLEPSRPGWMRYRLGLRAAAEFLLRKDYRTDWDTELVEEYTYLSQDGFERAFRERGLRVVCSRPVWNPWIVTNRFVGRAALATLTGAPLDFPPTNYLIVGEKAPDGGGVVLEEAGRSALNAPGFLLLSAYRHADGRIYELAERPGTTVDVVPWYARGDQVFVLAKQDFPRPIVNACADQPRLDRLTLAGYLTEPISAMVANGEHESDAVRRALRERAGLADAAMLGLDEPASYYPSPGGLGERVIGYLAEIEPQPDQPLAIANYTQFRSAGSIRALDAMQVLRACQVGGMVDARLEAAIYRLLGRLGRSPGPWIGATIALGRPHREVTLPPVARAVEALNPPIRAVFTLADPAERPGFLTVWSGRFAERDRVGAVLAEALLEYVTPSQLSRSTVVALPVLDSPEGTLVGLEPRVLPAPQHQSGNAALICAPAWRLERTVTDRLGLQRALAEGLQRDLGLAARQVWELGGPYFPSPGLTPEVVYPFAVEITPQSAMDSELIFVRLAELGAALDQVHDMHLLIAAARLHHALAEGPGALHPEGTRAAPETPPDAIPQP